MNFLPASSTPLVVVAAFFALSAPSRGADARRGGDREAPVQELFQTDLVYPQARGEFQLSAATSFRRTVDRDLILETPITLEYGLTDTWQVEVEYSGLTAQRPAHGRWARGGSDLEFGTQYSLMNISDTRLHAAARFSISVPTGDAPMEDEEEDGDVVEYLPAIILARDLLIFPGAQVFAEVGLGFMQRTNASGDPAAREPVAHEIKWGVGFFAPVSHLVVSVELGGRNNRWNRDGDENELYVTPGLTWKSHPSLELGLGTSIGLNRGSDPLRITARLTREF